MPSRKKAKGKARRAAKAEAAAAAAAKVNEAKEDQALAINHQEKVSLEALIKQLGVNFSERCKHGYPPISQDDAKIVEDFIDAFVAAYRTSAPENNIVKMLLAAEQATLEEYAVIYSSKLEVCLSMLMASGTQYILDGNIEVACASATLACYFEEWIAVNVRETKAIFNWVKSFELDDADDHTLVQYFRKRIPCACLDKKYKEVKSVKKLGWCYNPSCTKPNRMTERSKMFSCARCGEVNYCSVECQKENWKLHKKDCDKIVAVKAAFDSEQQS